MARFHAHHRPHRHHIIHFAILFTLSTFITSPTLILCSTNDEDFSIIDFDDNLFHHDYSPPSPPPPPPHPPSVSCTHDLDGVGTLDSTCQIVNDLNLTRDVYISGKGNFEILTGVKLHCPLSGCWITVNISGNFSLGVNSSIVTGTFELLAQNASFLNNSVVNTTGLAGKPPPQTSGTPQGIDGGGGGHGGRGASCLVDDSKLPEDFWGGDAYSWSSLQKPWSYGSRGGTTSGEFDYGGGGGGRIKMVTKGFVVLDGSVLADGGDGWHKGGGGSGGSIYIAAYKM